MGKLTHQADANQRSEAGMFYPTGYIVAGFESSTSAREAQRRLQQQGFGSDDVTLVAARQMAQEAEKNLESPSLFASMGSSLPVRQKQLELAQNGWDFLLIHAAQHDEEEHAVQALTGTGVRYAIKYRPLIIENLMPNIPTSAEHVPARVP
jgi:hypothetical protein